MEENEKKNTSDSNKISIDIILITIGGESDSITKVKSYESILVPNLGDILHYNSMAYKVMDRVISLNHSNRIEIYVKKIA